MNNLFVIDGKNVCHWIDQLTRVDKDLSIQPLLSVISALQRNEDDFICIFDANTAHALRDNGKAMEAQVVLDLTEKYPDRFRFVASGTKADTLILAEADDRNCEVISGDRYQDKEYKERYEWLRHEHPPRLIRANLTEKAVIFDDKLTLLRVPLLQDMAQAFADIGSMIPPTPPRFMPPSDDVVVAAKNRMRHADVDEEETLHLEEIRMLARQRKSAETQAANRNEKIHQASAIALKTGLGILSFLAVVDTIMNLMPPKDRN
jgi:hypothetical protein